MPFLKLVKEFQPLDPSLVLKRQVEAIDGVHVNSRCWLPAPFQESVLMRSQVWCGMKAQQRAAPVLHQEWHAVQSNPIPAEDQMLLTATKVMYLMHVWAWEGMERKNMAKKLCPSQVGQCRTKEDAWLMQLLKSYVWWNFTGVQWIALIVSAGQSSTGRRSRYGTADLAASSIKNACRESLWSCTR